MPDYNDISREWRRVYQLMRNMNKAEGTRYTMRMAFGAPTVAQLDTLMGIRSRQDLIYYLAQAGVKAPPPPKVEEIAFQNLLDRFSYLPEEFGNTLTTFLTQLAETTETRVIQDAIKSIIWTLDVSVKYKGNQYGRYYRETIKEIADDARAASPDKISEINEIERQALESAERAIETAAYMDE